MKMFPVYCAAIAMLVMGCESSRGCGRSLDGDHAHGGAHEEGVVKGSHGGRLLTDGNFAVEVTIFERGVPPEFRLYVYADGEPLEPREAAATIDLHRFGDRVDHFRFAPRDDYLLGDAVVEEPHSFEVELAAQHQGADHRWRYESWEGRTEISTEAITSSGIEIETVGPATIHTFVKAHGRIVPNEDRLAHFVARFPGIVRDVRKRLGDPVVRGEVLAVIESNESLQPYEVKASIDGTVIAKGVTAGEFTSEAKSIYTIADLSTVWADFNVVPEDFDRLQVGQPVSVEIGQESTAAEGKIVYLSPLGAEATQTSIARVELSNSDARLRPGLFVTGDILVDEATVPVSVKTAGLQTFRDWDVVFLNDGTVFQVAPLELGRRDRDHVEVLGGVKPGDRYAAEGSFIVKADVGKSGASHDH